MPTGIYKRTEAIKRNMSLAQTGKVTSEETKKKMSLARTGIEQEKKKIKYKRISSPYLELEEDCLICTSHCRDTSGYPLIRRNGKLENISRYIWRKFIGEIPKGMLVCHKCDNPECISLEHLFLGTSINNAQDMVRKGRQRKSKIMENIEVKNEVNALDLVNTKNY